jgi:hypothetical protein
MSNLTESDLVRDLRGFVRMFARNEAPTMKGKRQQADYSSSLRVQ